MASMSQFSGSYLSRNLNLNSLEINIIPALTERKKENSLDGKFMQGRGKLSKGSRTGKCESVHIKEDINSRIGGGGRRHIAQHCTQ